LKGEPGEGGRESWKLSGVEGTGCAGVFSIQWAVFRGRMAEAGEVGFALHGPGDESRESKQGKDGGLRIED